MHSILKYYIVLVSVYFYMFRDFIVMSATCQQSAQARQHYVWCAWPKNKQQSWPILPCRHLPCNILPHRDQHQMEWQQYPPLGPRSLLYTILIRNGGGSTRLCKSSSLRLCEHGFCCLQGAIDYSFIGLSQEVTRDRKWVQCFLPYRRRRTTYSWTVLNKSPVQIKYLQISLLRLQFPRDLCSHSVDRKHWQ